VSAPAPAIPLPAPPSAPDRPRAARRFARVVRLADWWNFKLPPLLAIGYWFLAGPRALGLGEALTTCALFLVASVGIAAFGHLVNDLGDLDADRRAGRPSALAGWSAARRTAAVAGALALALAPWRAIPGGAPVLAWVAAELALFVAYAIRPLRLKERGALGVVADALYGHAIPAAVATLVFGSLCGRDRAAGFRAVFAAIVLWKLLQGLCGALLSQLRDRRADRRAGTRTLALAWGPRPTLAFLDAWLLPGQFVAFLAVLALAERDLPGILLIYAAFLAATGFKVHRVWRKPASFYHRDYPGYAYLNDFHERWLPLAALAYLVGRRPELAPLALAHVALFRSALSDLLGAALRRWNAGRA
jgi:4-hydroxybenzoate polyprenyltransferase